LSVPAPPSSVSGAVAAVQHVVAGSAGDDVRVVVAQELLASGSRADQVLDRDAQLVPGEGGADGVHALAHDFIDLVAGVVDHEGVVPGRADHDVGARAAVQQVVAGEAGQQVHTAMAVKGVIAGQAVDDVVAVVAFERVVKAGAAQVLEAGVGVSCRIAGSRQAAGQQGGGHARGGRVEGYGVTAQAAR
jgi:hypothetical protein